MYSSYILAFLVLVGLTSLANGQLMRCGLGSNNPCKNGGRCIDQPATFYGYSCQCTGSWTGVNCDQYRNDGQYGGQYNNYPNNQNNQPYHNPNNPYGNNHHNHHNNNNNPYNPFQPQHPPNNPYNPYPSGGGVGGSNIYINQPAMGCSSMPCFNGAQCQPNGPYSFTCLCRYGYYGQRCESYRNPKGTLLGIVLGTVLPFFAVVIIVSLVCFFCCCRRSNCCLF